MSNNDRKYVRCWCCDFEYQKLLAHCSNCGQPNANVDFEAAQKAMQELSEREAMGFPTNGTPNNRGAGV